MNLHEELDNCLLFFFFNFPSLLASLDVVSHQHHAITICQLWHKIRIATGGTMHRHCFAMSVIRVKLGCLKMWEGTGTSSQCLTLWCLWFWLGFIQLGAVLFKIQEGHKRITRMAKTRWPKSDPDGTIIGESNSIKFSPCFWKKPASLSLSFNSN